MRFPGVFPALRVWFDNLQESHPEAHISCAGRGEIEQEAVLRKGASRAPWKKSAHNWNAAVDIFEMSGDRSNIYERAWFEKIVAPRIPDFLVWYGAPGAPFPELPHVEIKGWRELAAQGKLKLVE